MVQVSGQNRSNFLFFFNFRSILGYLYFCFLKKSDSVFGIFLKLASGNLGRLKIQRNDEFHISKFHWNRSVDFQLLTEEIFRPQISDQWGQNPQLSPWNVKSETMISQALALKTTYVYCLPKVDPCISTG